MKFSKGWRIVLFMVVAIALLTVLSLVFPQSGGETGTIISWDIPTVEPTAKPNSTVTPTPISSPDGWGGGNTQTQGDK